MIYYSDPEKQEKLEEAIRLGFIEMSRDNDGLIRYKLTNKGMVQWQREIMFK